MENVITNNGNLLGQTKERNYGIDLLRIVSMFLVCILHVLGHGGILNNTTENTVNYNVAWIMNISAYCAVNCYALISGYVGIKSKFKFVLYGLCFKILDDLKTELLFKCTLYF